MDNLIIRPPQDNELNFIYNSYLKSNRNNLEHMNMSNEFYYKTMTSILQSILSRSTINMLIETTNNEIIGYMIVENTNNIQLVHFAYIKFAFRKLNLFTYLWNSVIDLNKSIICTHNGKIIDYLIKKYNITYIPFHLIKEI
jgi:hypothetical protein